MAYPRPSYSARAPGLSMLTCSHISSKPQSFVSRSEYRMIAVATPDRRASGATATFARYERYGFEDGNGGGSALSGTHTCNVALAMSSRFLPSFVKGRDGDVSERFSPSGAPSTRRNFPFGFFFASPFFSPGSRADTSPVLTPPSTAPSATSWIHCLARARLISSGDRGVRWSSSRAASISSEIRSRISVSCSTVNASTDVRVRCNVCSSLAVARAFTRPNSACAWFAARRFSRMFRVMTLVRSLIIAVS
mmetsp:Transcript_14139/g.60527  ORF Transcript_14139/g.60527 Transcript_14139/m.60527 type:complete len:250 (-) Transcript_14139:435-1184(-)